MKEIKSDNYSIWIGDQSLSKLELIKYSKIGVLVDENTKEFCLPLLPQLQKNLIIEIKSGEEYKNLDNCNYIWNKLTENCFDRNSVLINLGGGVIADMGGFCASTYKRGIDFIQVPTTLLSMVDASVGGKLGIDIQQLKNQVGLFANPRSVIIYPKFLESLQENQLKSGFAEIVKHALISDKNLWKKIINTSFNDLDWENLIQHSIVIKNNIVLLDPKEKNLRKKLNFGHTFGHAIESYYLKKGSNISHGEAIFMGIILESELSFILDSEKNQIKNYILSNFPLPDFPEKSELLNFMKNDKKNVDGKINFSLLKGIGDCTINNFFSEDEL